MRHPPLILVSPDVDVKGVEMGDLSISLSECYQRAVLGAGGIPVAMPATVSPTAVAECVRRTDGVLLTGGEDVAAELYAAEMPARLRAKVKVTPDGGARDLRELLLVAEVFRQRKPLLAICRGHQLLNVALGGTLCADLPTQMPGAFEHRQMEKKFECVHEVHLTPDSLLAKITGARSFGVNSTHHQAVSRPANVLEVAASSPDGVIEAMQLKPGAARMLPFLLSVQFHPERLMDRFPEHRAIFAVFTQACQLNSNRKL